jgi:hypothetical protein
MYSRVSEAKNAFCLGNDLFPDQIPNEY